MFGIGVTNNADTVPAQLQTILRRDHGLAVNVVNLAVRGYVGFQEMTTLERHLARHPADAAVSVSGYNDATTFLTPEAGAVSRAEPPPEIRQITRSSAWLPVRNSLSRLAAWTPCWSGMGCPASNNWTRRHSGRQ